MNVAALIAGRGMLTVCQKLLLAAQTVSDKFARAPDTVGSASDRGSVGSKRATYVARSMTVAVLINA